MTTINLLIPFCKINVLPAGLGDKCYLIFQGEFVSWFPDFTTALDYAYSEFYVVGSVAP
jgi:hypothetical protein